MSESPVSRLREPTGDPEIDAALDELDDLADVRSASTMIILPGRTRRRTRR